MKKNTYIGANSILFTFLMIASCGHKHVQIRSVAADSIAYFCPMDSMINENKAGNCSVCGMDLVKNPLYVGEEENSVVITSTGDTLAN